MNLVKTLSAGAAALALTTAFTTAFVPTVAHAQSTTGAIRGVVTGPNGSPVSGATVTITDTRTGASSTTTTNSSGIYAARGLNVSGEYTVRVTSSSFAPQSVSEIGLTVGDTTSVPFQLTAAGGDEIVVVASRSNVVDVAAGPSAVFTADDINSLPSLGRDIKDIIRLDPRVNIDEVSRDRRVSCVGSNPRFNSLTVDGVRQNDDFGLNGNGYPTQRLPFPFDVVEQLAVEISPVDVEYGGFTGCNINAVTKTGSNEFGGRLFVDYNFADLHGDTLEGDAINKPDTDQRTYGAVLTGPVIKDRLFFTAAYEKFKGSDNPTTGPAGSSFSNTVDSVTQADLDRITEISNRVYGFDPLGIPTGLDVEDERFYVKLNGFINDDHRIELVYQDTVGDNVNVQNTSARRGNLSLSSNWYRRTEDLEVYSGRIFSQWGDNLNTEIGVSYKDSVTGQNPLNGDDFAQMEIATAAGGTVFIGPDQFRHGNALSNTALNLRFKAEYAAGNHLFKIGYERDTLDVFNKFVPFSEGVVEYNSIADFEAQQPDNIFYLNAGTNDENDAAATFKRTLNTVYLQDEWTPLDSVTVNAGLRFDWYQQGDAPEFNPLVLERFGVPSNTTFDGLSLFQPRIGVEYEHSDRLSFSAGIGRFSGGDPTVWLSNSFSNTGLITGTSFSNNSAVINGFDGFNLPAEMQAAVTASAARGTGQVSLLDPDYKLASIWRMSAGVEYFADLSAIGLGDEWELGADFLYTITENGNNWQNLDLGQIGTAPDGRPIYNSRFGYRNSGVLNLTNAEENTAALVLSAYLKKEWDISDRFRTGLVLGYAYTDAEDVSPATSSTQQSNFENVARIDYNNPIAARANETLTHSLRARWDVTYEIVRGYESKLSFFGILQSGKPFSYTFDTNGGSDAIAGGANLFGDSDDSERRSLLYVPTGANDPLVDFSQLSGQQVAELFSFFEQAGLNEYAGGIAPRNAFESDWKGKIDLRFRQELPGIPGILPGDRLSFIIDVNNLTNLLNDDWGIYRETTFGGSGYNTAIVESEISEDGTQFVFTDTNLRNSPSDFQNRIARASAWEINFGLRYDF